MERLLYKLIFQIKKLYWFIFRPKTVGVKCVIENNGKILMIKRTLPNSKWVFPGGAVRRGESFGGAVFREIKEDLGFVLKNIRYLGNFIIEVKYRAETIHCFGANVEDINMSGDEIKLSEIKWFLPAELPQPLTLISEKVFNLWLQNK